MLFDCDQVIPAYNQLISLAKAHNVSVLVVSDKLSWAHGRGLLLDGTKQITGRPNSFGIGLNPGVLWVSPDGTVIQQWLGNLDALEVGQIQEKLLRVVPVPPVLNGSVSESFINRLSDTRDFVFLDVRERADFAAKPHRQNAVNLPIDEIDFRWRHELDKLSPTVIDCSVVPAGTCEYAKVLLETQGFRSVGLLDLGRLPPPGCRISDKEKNIHKDL